MGPDLRAELHAAREALAAAERERDRLGALVRTFDDAGSGSWTLDLATGEGRWSPRMHQVMGTDPASSPTHGTFLSMLHPDDLPASRVRAEDMKAGRIAFDRSRFRIVTPAGEVRWVDATVQLMRDATGAPAILCGTVADVTGVLRIQDERLQALADLAATSAENRHRGELLEEAQRIAGIGSWSYDAQTDRVTWSRTMFTITGIAPDVTPDADTYRELVHPDDKDDAARIAGVGATNGEPYLVEHRLLRPDGQERLILVRAQVDVSPEGERRLSGTVQDVTDERRAQRQLVESVDLFQQLIDAATGQAIIGSDPGGRIRVWSRGAERMLGWSTREAFGQLAQELAYHPSEIPRAMASFRALGLPEAERRRPDGSMPYGEGDAPWTWIRKDGSTLSVSLRLNPMRDADGEITGYVGIATDVTHELRLEAERAAATAALTQSEADLRRAMDEAVAANAAKSAFLATMSHEIRTPMNAVIGLTGLLLDTDLDPQQRDLLQTVRTSGDQLLAVINDVLDFSKIEAGELDLEVRPFDLRDVVTGSVAQFAAAADGLELTAEVDDACPATVVGDVTRLRQVLANLVGNAVKFTTSGAVRVSVDPAGPDRLRFRVRDTGIGIAAEAMDRLFESFSQVDASTTRVYGGTGLGLAISRALVEAMGGTIGVESVPGAGSTFTVTVPLAGAPERRRRPRPPAPRTPADPVVALRILLAEDNEVNQKVGRLMLGKLGHEVIVAANGAEALAAVREHAFDVVLMDMHMPVMDGLEATRRIRDELPPERRPVVVAMTASVTLEDREACAAAGMEAYLSKPVRAPELARVLAELAGSAGSRAGRGSA